MPVPTEQLNLTTPAGSDNISAGDNEIRRAKTQFQEILNVDHDVPTTAYADDVGQHKKVTLQEQTDLGTGAVGTTILGNQAGKLVYTDEADNDVVICDETTGGVLASSVKGVYNVDNLAALANIMNFVYPVGSVVTLGVSTNPATLFGVGTWTAIAGKVIVGIDATQTEFDTLNETGGAKTHTLSVDELPPHTHPQNINDGTSGTNNDPERTNSASGGVVSGTNTTGSTGGGTAFSILDPYIVKYVWERTA